MGALKLLGIVSLIIAIALGCLSYHFSPTSQNGPKYKNLPPGSLGLPIIGETHNLLFSSPEWVHSRYQKYGPISRSYMLGADTLILSGFKAATLFYNDTFFDRVNHNPAFVDKVLPNNVNSKTGDRFSKTKNLIRAALSSPIIDRAMPEITQRLSHMLSNISSQLNSTTVTNVKLAPHFVSWNYDALSLILFSEIDENIKSLYLSTIVDGLNSPPIDLSFTPFGKSVRNVPLLLSYLQKQIEKHESLPDLYMNDGLTILLKKNMELESTDRLSHYDITCELHHLFGAGLFVHSPFGFFLQHIQQRPDIHELIKEEVDYFGYDDENGIDGLTHAWNLPMTTSAYLESRRMSHGVKFIGATVKKDFVYYARKGVKYDIPKGWWALLAVSTVGRDPARFAENAITEDHDSMAEAHTWDYNKFLGKTYNDDEMSMEMDAQTYMRTVSQGGGVASITHACPGWNLSGRLIISAIVKLTYEYEWELDDMNAPPTNGVFAKVSDDITLKKLIQKPKKITDDKPLNVNKITL